MAKTSKIPRWKHLLSYLADIPIDEGRTEVNPSLQLQLSKGRFCLSTPNAVYSYGDLYRNYFEAFKRLNLPALRGQEVLLLGLGMGSIPFMLEKKFGMKYCYTAVELDEVIASWATEYTLPELASPVTIYTADAYQFVMNTTQQFDLIAVDIFLDEMVPDTFDNPAFAARLNELLKDEGLIIWNRLADSKFRQRTTDYFQKIFKTVFPEAVSFEIGANWMLMNHGRFSK
ncbi:MAG: spermidine synthase [Saprospiraceae bacterium]